MDYVVDSFLLQLIMHKYRIRFLHFKTFFLFGMNAWERKMELFEKYIYISTTDNLLSFLCKVNLSND